MSTNDTSRDNRHARLLETYEASSFRCATPPDAARNTQQFSTTDGSPNGEPRPKCNGFPPPVTALPVDYLHRVVPAPSAPYTRPGHNESPIAHIVQGQGNTGRTDANTAATIGVVGQSQKRDPIDERWLIPRPTRHKVYGVQRHAHGWTSRSPTAIGCPPSGLTRSHGTVYVHVHDNGKQIWLWNARAYASGAALNTGETTGRAGKGGVWETIGVGHAHPSLVGRVLHVDKQGRARWVTKHYAQKLARERKKESARLSEA
ncbi:hypothetical protein C8Q76DRAFT_696914 [Earliella scabrosa]|nr:hypothetical protein C8Q76DRAFT_696914 [Earliella scabrosa]